MIKPHLSLFALLLFSANSFADSHKVYGIYLVQEKNSHVQIADCGDGSPCGVIVWLDPTRLPTGITPEAARSKAGKPVLGSTMLEGFSRKRDDWRDGTIYHPGKDKTYASRLRRLANGNLEVKGCISIFCQTQIWTQVVQNTK
ncbi:MAG: hypothetical protein ACI9OI_002310 [Chitinophagales bacterium]|jgi:uncharacterized protein (DUF2147 family)